MPRLQRRRPAEFLSDPDLKLLAKRCASAGKIALTTDPGTKIRDAWDNFRQGKSARGVCDQLWVELKAMAYEKCALCEVPGPNTIEHLAEKARFPGKAFDFENLLAACGTCNLSRENSGSAAPPLDPSAMEPLDLLGWDEYGSFIAATSQRSHVDNHVAMYGLDRVKGERAKMVRVLRALLAAAALEEPIQSATRAGLESLLAATSGWLGPVREYLLRPPSPNDALILDAALHRLPALRTWVSAWLHPPPWAAPRWP